ncbi:hypothetical protein RRG08_021791 [Elysia crispata]|uniref:Uncharacterized protein n=1 Tax=Elysia crispata TaxID=231223 RepID=A0AAE0ZY36_9GAST|nr:hypothetical protein RRG08_021791 [Elysia crispata]
MGMLFQVGLPRPRQSRDSGDSRNALRISPVLVLPLYSSIRIVILKKILVQEIYCAEQFNSVHKHAYTYIKST